MPLSPRIRIGAFVGAASSSLRSTSCHAGDRPLIISGPAGRGARQLVDLDAAKQRRGDLGDRGDRAQRACIEAARLARRDGEHADRPALVAGSAPRRCSRRRSGSACRADRATCRGQVRLVGVEHVERDAGAVVASCLTTRGSVTVTPLTTWWTSTRPLGVLVPHEQRAVLGAGLLERDRDELGLDRAVAAWRRSSISACSIVRMPSRCASAAAAGNVRIDRAARCGGASARHRHRRRAAQSRASATSARGHGRRPSRCSSTVLRSASAASR